MIDPKEEIKLLYRIQSSYFTVHRHNIDREGWPAVEDQRFEYAQICGGLSTLESVWIRLGYDLLELTEARLEAEKRLRDNGIIP